MQSTNQLTIRGIDTRTKQRLAAIATHKGVSLNKLVVETLQQTAGTNTAEERLQVMRGALRKFRIDSKDIKIAEAAIAEMDVISKAKQKRDDHDLGF